MAIPFTAWFIHIITEIFRFQRGATNFGYGPSPLQITKVTWPPTYDAQSRPFFRSFGGVFG